MKKVGFVLGAVLFVSVLFHFFPNILKPEVKIGETTMRVDVADTEKLRTLGLSGRSSLCAHCGMLFKFDKPGPYGFWMKGMNFPIDIVWISAEKRIIGVENSTTPDSYPTVFYPTEPVLYVLELPAGAVLKWHIDTGDEVLFDL